MKTIEDLYKLQNELISLVYGDDYEVSLEGESNEVIYQRDGWDIAVYYTCYGMIESEEGDYWTPPSFDIVRNSVMVDEIHALHLDEKTGEETVFLPDDADDLCMAMNRRLANLRRT